MGERVVLRTLQITALLCFLGASLSVGPPADVEAAKTAKPTRIEGTLIDTRCYSIDKSLTQDGHRTVDGTIDGCAAACAKLGIPTGVLTSKGDVTILIAPATELADYMGRQVRAAGVKVFRGAAIRVDTVEVRGEDGAWKPVEFHSMM